MLQTSGCISLILLIEIKVMPYHSNTGRLLGIDIHEEMGELLKLRTFFLQCSSVRPSCFSKMQHLLLKPMLISPVLLGAIDTSVLF